MKRGPTDENLKDERVSKRRRTDSSYQISYGPVLRVDELKAALPGTVRIYYRNGLKYQFKHSSGVYFSESILIELANNTDFIYASCYYMPSEIFDKLLKPEEKIAAEQYVKSQLQAIEQYAPICIGAKPMKYSIGINEIGYHTTSSEHEYYQQLISENRNHTKLLELLNELKTDIDSYFMKSNGDTDDLLAMHHRINYLLNNIPQSLEDAFLPFSLDYNTPPYHFKLKFPDLLKNIDAGAFANQSIEFVQGESIAPMHEENIIKVLPLEMISHILSFLTISNIEHAAQVHSAFRRAAENPLIWQQKVTDYDVPLDKINEKNELSLKQKLKNYLIEISVKFPPALISAIGLSKFFEYPKLQNVSWKEITPEMMQGNEIMWGIIPAKEEDERSFSHAETPLVALCLKSKFSNKLCSVKLYRGSGDHPHYEPVWGISNNTYCADDILPHDEKRPRANALTWDFIGRLSRHEPCGLPKYVNRSYVGEGNRTLPDGRSALELTDQSPSAIVRRL